MSKRFSTSHRLHRVDYIRAKYFSSEGNCCSDAFCRQPRMFGQDMIRRLACREFLQNQLNRDSGPDDNWFTHHDLGVGRDQLLWHWGGSLHAIMSGVRRFENSYRRILQRKKLFDAAFYLERYPDVGATRMHPFAHYLLHGAAEGRKPNRWFDPFYYLARYQEARNRGGDPFVDYLKYGAKESASPHPLLDGERESGRVTEGAQFACDS